MSSPGEQEKIVEQLTSFLKTFKLTLAAKIHLFYSIITYGDTQNLIQKVLARDGQYKHASVASVTLTQETCKIVERFCMRISEFLEFRLCLLKSLKEEWLCHEISCFQGSLKKCFIQVKNLKTLDIVVKRIVDCRNIFAKNVLEKIVKVKFIQGQDVKEIRKVFIEKLMQSLPENQKGDGMSNALSQKTWVSERQNNPFIDHQKDEKGSLMQKTNDQRKPYNAVSKIVDSLIENEKTGKIKQSKRKKVSIHLSTKKMNQSAVWSLATLPQNQHLETDSSVPNNYSKEENLPKLPVLTSKLSGKSTKETSEKQQKKRNHKGNGACLHKNQMNKYQYFDCLKKMMDLDDTYWLNNAKYASTMRQLKELNRKNETAIIKFSEKYRRSAFKTKLNNKKPPIKITKQQIPSPFQQQKQISRNPTQQNKQKTSMLKTQTARPNSNQFSRIKTLSSNSMKPEQGDFPKLQFGEDSLPALQKRLLSIFH